MSDIVNVDYSTKIPNNVNLAEDRQVLRALESYERQRIVLAFLVDQPQTRQRPEQIDGVRAVA